MFKQSLAVLAAAILSLSAHANEKLVVGATPVPHAEILEFVKPVLAKEGVDLAIRFGYQRFQTDVMIVTVVLLLILVQVLQSVGDKLVVHFSRK